MRVAFIDGPWVGRLDDIHRLPWRVPIPVPLEEIGLGVRCEDCQGSGRRGPGRLFKGGAIWDCRACSGTGRRHDTSPKAECRVAEYEQVGEGEINLIGLPRGLIAIAASERWLKRGCSARTGSPVPTDADREIESRFGELVDRLARRVYARSGNREAAPCRD